MTAVVDMAFVQFSGKNSFAGPTGEESPEQERMHGSDMAYTARQHPLDGLKQARCDEWLMDALVDFSHLRESPSGRSPRLRQGSPRGTAPLSGIPSDC